MKNVKTLKIIALVFPGLTLGILLLFTFGETIGGDWSGLGHLVQAIPIGFLMWLGWKHPLSGGILFLVLGFLAAYSLSAVLRGADWLAPMLIKEIFEIIERLNTDDGISILLVEQNVKLALSTAPAAYVLENGRVVMEGPAETLRENPDIRDFYLGLTELGARKSFRAVKHYKRRKRWLS